MNASQVTRVEAPSADWELVEKEGYYYGGEAKCETNNGFEITLCLMWCSNEVFKLMVMRDRAVLAAALYISSEQPKAS